MSTRPGAAAVLLPAIASAVVVGASSYYLWKRIFKRAGTITVTGLNIYPVKSCRELPVDAAVPTVRGFAGDRIAQVTDANGKYCTPREKDKAKLFQVQAEVWGDDRLILRSPDVEESIEVDTGTEKTLTSQSVEVLGAPEKLTLLDYGDEAAAWLEKATGIPGCRLTGMGPSFDRSSVINPDQEEAVPTSDGRAPMSLADEAPFLLVNAASLKDLNKRLKARKKMPVDMRRFRPNVVISGLKPWEEDSLKRIRINGVEFMVWQRCGRCIMTTIDRDTLERGPEPLATLSTFRERAHGQRNFGVHLIPVAESIVDGSSLVAVDDDVEVLEYDEDRRKEWLELFG
eukprot:CAMPEP_0197717570 /NCGR_PEP_ID=MMETSP1434-20131217/2061_1 /TAXON_ID=265543 /ORGANISM="Minutocellus polymorphus, Strain CCMP3303" /LENGTH=342 /DNA_ID=CAMNT_0043302119 /DNA_START=30 /DNA_END=1058 /DNA_ORIENTATION=-